MLLLLAWGFWSGPRYPIVGPAKDEGVCGSKSQRWREGGCHCLLSVAQRQQACPGSEARVATGALAEPDLPEPRGRLAVDP